VPIKHNPMQKFLIIIIFSSLTVSGFAQPKYEKEIRIKETDVPDFARSFVDSLNFNKKVKWYKEFGFDKTSFEAKSKTKGKRYSIEFSQDGLFEDLEIEIQDDEIPPDTFSRITAHLSSTHKKFSIDKIQIQYSGNRNLVLAFFRNEGPLDGIDIHYEIMIATKTDGVYVLYEDLFSENGDFVRSSEVILKSTDNIEY
jgi:hypothetical protein